MSARTAGGGSNPPWCFIHPSPDAGSSNVRTVVSPDQKVGSNPTPAFRRKAQPIPGHLAQIQPAASSCRVSTALAQGDNWYSLSEPRCVRRSAQFEWKRPAGWTGIDSNNEMFHGCYKRVENNISSRAADIPPPYRVRPSLVSGSRADTPPDKSPSYLESQCRSC